MVITITSENYVNKGPGRPYFNDDMRVKSLAALECVDFVVLILVEVGQVIFAEFLAPGENLGEAENLVK